MSNWNKTPRGLTYNSWWHMHQRCKNSPWYVNVTVCDRWQEFDNFVADMGLKPEGLTLERINNALGYQPDNCIWGTTVRQAYNRGNCSYITQRTPNCYRLSFCIRPGYRFVQHSKDREVLEAVLSDLRFEREMHLRLGFY